MPGVDGLSASPIDVGRTGRLGRRQPAARRARLNEPRAGRGRPWIGLLLLFLSAASVADDCPAPQGVTLQVLGSGGPIADDARASSSYLVWLDGKARVLVDAGGGAFLRFGEAGARFTDLDHVAISHFHTDHSADLVALLKTGYFSGRTRPLGISGPGAGGPFPSLTTFLDASIGPGGAYGYLSGYLDGSDGLARLELVEPDPSGGEKDPVRHLADRGVTITATGVPHGIVPALAYRVRADDTDIVFAGDQNGNDERFIEFARGADIMVMHMPVPEGVEGAGRALHAPPSRIGEIAETAGVRHLVLSHFMARSLADFDDNFTEVRQRYGGRITVAEDLMCIRPSAD